MVANIEPGLLAQLIATKTIKEIADQYSCSTSTIHHRMKEAGIVSPRKRSKADYTGKTFGSWEVICKAPGRKSTWVCRCQCGVERPVKSSNLLGGKSTKCMNCTSTGCGRITGTIWANIRNGAVQRKLDFDITVEEAWELYEKQKGLCALTGMSIDFKPRGKSRSNTTASLDRIDSHQGYTINNIQWVYKKINMMKQAYSNDEFIELCRKVSNYNA